MLCTEMRITFCLWELLEDDGEEPALFFHVAGVVVRFMASTYSLEYPCPHQCLHCHR